MSSQITQEATGPDIRLEPSRRRVRAFFAGRRIVDSRRALLVWESSRPPLYWFPIDDVRVDLLEPLPRPERDGAPQRYTLRSGSRLAENAAWTYPHPTETQRALDGHIGFVWDQLDAWFEEDEEVFVHPRDPYTRVDVLASSCHLRVGINGVVVADTRRPQLLFETGLPTRYYIPKLDVRMDLLEATPSTTRCPYKGIASYWSVRTCDALVTDVVWSYPAPIPECSKIENLLCFYNERVDITVDEELQPRPQPRWSLRNGPNRLRP